MQQWVYGRGQTKQRDSLQQVVSVKEVLRAAATKGAAVLGAEHRQVIHPYLHFPTA